MDQGKQRIWLIILYLVVLLVLLRVVPTIGYGVAAITLLALLFKLRGKGKAK
jgi:hypothetical protein